MIRRPIKRSTVLLLGVASFVILIAGYTLLSHLQHLQNPKDTTIPTWSQIQEGVGKMVQFNERDQIRWLVADTRATATRLFIGLAYGILGGVLLGMMMGCFTQMESFFYPPLSFLAKIPPTAALAVFFALVGTGRQMYVAMLAFGVLPTLAITVYLAVKQFPEELQFKAYTLGASHLEVMGTIIFRYVLPKVIDAVRLCIGPAMVFLIAAEMVVGDVGFGYRIRLESKLLNMSVVYPYLALLAGFGFAMDYTLTLFQRMMCPWYEKGHG